MFPGHYQGPYFGGTLSGGFIDVPLLGNALYPALLSHHDLAEAIASTAKFCFRTGVIRAP
jgi:hypothetical protein